MFSIKLAYRNLMGARLRTWLSVFVLSLSYVVIIWQQGLLDGWNQQAQRDTINWEIGGGQYWQNNYDPYDPFTLDKSHTLLPEVVQIEIERGTMTPILISQATLYPEGRLQSVLLKGIDPEQTILSIPSRYLESDIEEIPAIIGARMAKNTQLKVGDLVTVRWRDVHGTFDAEEIKIVHIFKTNVPTVDNNILWIPLKRHWQMMQLFGEATILVTAPKFEGTLQLPGWIFRNHDFLLAEIKLIIRTKSIGGSIFFIVLLFLAMLAIFDTQVLSIFRRQKEIGTHMALGMTRGQVIRLFTMEGAMHGILAAILAALYGIPLLYFQAVKGLAMPQGSDEYGFAVAEKIFPVYSVGLIVFTTMIVLITTTIVSFLPTRRITQLKPTDALKGKIQ